MQPILVNAIGITVVLAFIITTILTLFSIFGYGSPPRYLIHVEANYKKLLFKSLIIELVVLCLGVASSNFYNVKKAAAGTKLIANKLSDSKIQSDKAISNLLREFWKPSSVINYSNESKLTNWLISNGLKDVSITLFLHAENFREKRSKAANDLILSPTISYSPKQFDGRVGKIFVKNTSLYPFKVTLWHPDSENIYQSWVINGPTNLYLSVNGEAINIGNDWGVQLGDSEVKSIDDAALWTNNEWRVSQNTFFK